MMFLVQCIDDTGYVRDDDVTGFRMNRDGAQAVCDFLNRTKETDAGFRPRVGWQYDTYIVVPVEGGAK